MNLKQLMLPSLGILFLALTALFAPWWYEWKPGDAMGMNIYDISIHPLWYKSPYGGEIVWFLYCGQLILGFAVLLFSIKTARRKSGKPK